MIFLSGLGKTLQTIALILTDDTGEDVIDEPEMPDGEYDDMTLIGKSFLRLLSRFHCSSSDVYILLQSVLSLSLRTGRISFIIMSDQSESNGYCITARIGISRVKN